MSDFSVYTGFTLAQFPSLRCPGCFNETLAIVRKSFKKETTARANAAHHHYGFDPDNEEYFFSCLLRCKRRECRQPVALSGEGWLEVTTRSINDGIELVTTETFRARSLFPPLPLFILPAGCGNALRGSLDEISSLMASYPSAAAGAIRRLLETLLDDLKVPRECTKEGGRTVPLKLHSRIENYPEILGVDQKRFMALKLLGNAGSHESREIARSALDDACQLLEHIIHLACRKNSDHTQQIERLERDFRPNG